jgi:broad specificity phosphatase PhoE
MGTEEALAELAFAFSLTEGQYTPEQVGEVATKAARLLCETIRSAKLQPGFKAREPKLGDWEHDTEEKRENEQRKRAAMDRTGGETRRISEMAVELADAFMRAEGDFTPEQVGEAAASAARAFAAPLPI